MLKKLFTKTAIFTTIVLMLGISNATIAKDNMPASQVVAKEQPTPDKLLKNAINMIVGFLRKSGAGDLGQILDFVDKEIAGYFDFKHMTKLAAGRYGRNMTSAELDELSRNIRTAFIESLAKNLVDYAYTNKKIRFLKPRRSRYGNEVTVMAKITHPRGYPTRIYFKFHPTKLGWKVYDLSANDQSAVLHYRGQIARMYSGYNDYPRY